MKRDLFIVMMWLAAIVAPPTRAAAAGKPSVAVLYFDNDTGDAAFKSRHFAETETYLRAMLSGSGKLPDGQPLLPACADPR